jgi:hypothetical protein
MVELREERSKFENLVCENGIKKKTGTQINFPTLKPMLAKFKIGFKTTTETFHTLMKITILHIMLFIESLNYLILYFKFFF